MIRGGAYSGWNTRASDFGNDGKKILADCIDIRLFGGVSHKIQERQGRKAQKDKIPLRSRIDR